MKKILKSLYNLNILKRMTEDGANALTFLPLIVMIMTLVTAGFFGAAIDKTTQYNWLQAALIYTVIITMVNWPLLKASVDRKGIIFRYVFSFVVAIPTVLFFEILLFEDEITSQLQQESIPRLEQLDSSYQIERSLMTNEKNKLANEIRDFQQILQTSSEREYHEIDNGSHGKHDIGTGPISQRYREIFKRDSALYTPRISQNDARIRIIEASLENSKEHNLQEKEKILSGEVYGMIDYIEALHKILEHSGWLSWCLYWFFFILGLILEMIVPIIKSLHHKHTLEYQRIACEVNDEETYFAKAAAEIQLGQKVELMEQESAEKLEEEKLRRELEHKRKIAEERKRHMHAMRKNDADDAAKESDLSKRTGRRISDTDLFAKWKANRKTSNNNRGPKSKDDE